MKIMGFTYIDGREQLLLKSDSALLVNRKPFFAPEDAGRIAAHPCLVLRISKLGKNISPRFARRYYDAVAAGLHIEDEAALKEAIAGGQSWTAAVAADGSMPVGTLIALSEQTPLPECIRFELNGAITELPISEQRIAEAVAEVSRVITVRQGDMLFVTANNEPLYPTMDQFITASIHNEDNLYCKIK